MSDSFQKEIPKARINITLDIEKNGARKKHELPLKLLVLGDFSGGQTTAAISHRERLSLRKENFDEVMQHVAPRIALKVPNRIDKEGNELSAHLCFRSLKDFHPENVVCAIPKLNRLLAMRHLLKELRAHVMDDAGLRRALQKIVQDKRALANLNTEFKQLGQLS